MQFIGTSMPCGYAGMLTRGAYTNVIEAKKNDKTAPVVDFGAPVKVNADKSGVSACSATADKVYGFAVRSYKQAGVTAGDDVVDAKGLVSVLRKGYIAVKVEDGAPNFGDPVYLNAKGKITANSASATAITGATFCGEKDADGVAEIAFNL